MVVPAGSCRRPACNSSSLLIGKNDFPFSSESDIGSVTVADKIRFRACNKVGVGVDSDPAPAPVTGMEGPRGKPDTVRDGGNSGGIRDSLSRCRYIK